MLHKELVADLCMLSKLSYKNSDALQTFMSNIPKSTKYSFLHNCSNLQFFESSNDAQCFTIKYRNRLIVCFRGTESIQDWITDAMVLQVPMDLEGVEDEERPQVHCGFLRQFRSIQDDITRIIHDYVIQTEMPRILFTGHSLGGALATLASLEYGIKYRHVPVNCVTFGSPRVGNDVFVRYFNHVTDESLRFVNQEDPIPGVPTELRFEHVPGIRYIDRRNRIHNEITENRECNFMMDCCLSVCTRTQNPIEDHRCSNYYENICRITKV